MHASFRTLVVLLALPLAACGSSKHATSLRTTGPSTTVAGAADPNAPEALTPGDIPDNQVFVTYTSTVDAFSLSYPQGWARKDTARGTTFSQNFNRIDVATTSGAVAPTVAAARAFAATTLRSLPGFKLVGVDTVTRRSGPAVHTVYDATSAINSVTGKSVTLQIERYEFWHNGTKLVITLSSPKGSDNVDPWKTVTDSLVWT